MAHFPKPFFKQARQLWYVEVERKQHCLGPDKDEAFRQYHVLMQSQKMASLGQASAGATSPLVAVVADAFLEWVKTERAPDTFEWYRYRLQRFCAKHPTLKASDLRPFHVQQWVDSYPQLSRSSRRNYFRTVKACMRWSLQQGYIDKNPIAHLSIPAGESREVTIPQADYERLLAAITDANFNDLVVFTWETGCRPQESLRIEARHVELARQRIVFPKAEAKGKRQPRVIYLTDKALEIVTRCVEKHPEGMILRQANSKPWMPGDAKRHFDRVQKEMGKVAYEQLGLPVTAEMIQKITARMSTHRQSGGQLVAKTPKSLLTEARQTARRQHARKFAPRYSLYALRHAWATRALESGLDGLTVAILMGHSDPSTLARVYQHLSHNPEHMLAQARRATPKV